MNRTEAEKLALQIELMESLGESWPTTTEGKVNALLELLPDDRLQEKNEALMRERGEMIKTHRENLKLQETVLMKTVEIMAKSWQKEKEKLEGDIVSLQTQLGL